MNSVRGILLFLALLGTAALPLGLYLEWDAGQSSPPVITIRIRDANRDTLSMEERITRPLEQALAHLAGISRISSRTSPGETLLILHTRTASRGFFPLSPASPSETSPQSRLDKLFLAVQAAVSRTSVRFPGTAEPARITCSRRIDRPLMILAFSQDREPTQLRKQLREDLVPRLRTIPGTGQIRCRGGRAQDLVMRMPKERDCHPRALASALRKTTGLFPGGYIHQGGLRIPLILDSRWETAQAFQRGLLMERAQLEREPRLSRETHLLNGQEPVTIAISDDGQSPIPLTSRRIRREIRSWDSRIWDPVIIYDGGEALRQELRNLSVSLVMSLILVLLCVGIVYPGGRILAAFGSSMLLSLYFSLSLLALLRIAVTPAVLSGLAMGCGLIADNGLVVLSSLTGSSPTGSSHAGGTAGKRGSQPVRGPITAATLSTLAALLPLVYPGALPPGLTGGGLQGNAAAIIILTAVSGLTFLYLFPALIPPGGLPNQPAGIFHLLSRRLPALFPRRRAILLLSLIPVLAGGFLFVSGGFNPAPARLDKDFFVRQEFPRGTSAEAARRAAQSFLRRLPTDPDQPPPLCRIQPDSVRYTLPMPKGRDSRRELIQFLHKAEAGSLPGIRLPGQLFLPGGFPAAGGQPLSGGTQNRIRIILTGTSLKDLRRAAGAVETALRRDESCQRVVREFKEPAPGWLLFPKRKRLAQDGLNLAGTAPFLTWTLAPPVLHKWQPRGALRETDMKIRWGMEPPAAGEDLQGRPILPEGSPPDLEKRHYSGSDLFTWKPSRFEVAIRRFNQRRSLSLTACWNTGSFTGALDKTQEVLVPLRDQVPQGVYLQIDPDDRSQRGLFTRYLLLGLAVLALLFLVLTIQFNSPGKAAAALLLLPLSTAPLLGLLHLLRGPATPPQLAGILILLGILLNNAILLINPLPPPARSCPAAVERKLSAALARRTAPIGVSAVTSILGALPPLFLAPPGTFAHSAAQVFSLGIILHLPVSLTAAPALLLCFYRLCPRGLLKKPSPG